MEKPIGSRMSQESIIVSSDQGKACGMKSHIYLFRIAFLILGLLLSSCAGLLTAPEEPVPGDFGPAYVPQEHQTRSFESLWSYVQDNYIYYAEADVDWDAIHDRYIERIQAGLTDEEFTELMRKLESELPAGSLAYQARQERIESDREDLSSYEGIGAFVGFDEEPEPHVVLLAVIEGSPAEQAGLKAHDSIFAIDGMPVLLEEGLDAVNRIRGPAGTSVMLDVQSPGREERSVEVPRARLTSTGQLEAYEIPNTPYAYMLFPPLAYATMMDDVITNLQSFTTNKTLEGLILDLRVAGSTRTWPFEALYTMFYNGAIGEYYDRDGKQLLQVKGQDVFDSQSIPLVILVGRNTIGSPEILAGSLQMHRRAVVVGAVTPGQIESSSAFYLPNGARIFVESASFVLPNGDEIGTNGVQPDVIVEAGWDDILPNSDPVLEAAIEILDSRR